VLLLALAPAALAAQTSGWDSPSFQSPGPHNDLGAYFIRPKDTDWGIAGTWRQSGGLNLGIRGEYVQILSGVSRWGLGAEVKGGLGPVAPPLAFNWTAGFGGLFGSGASVLSIPVGLTLGLHLNGGGLVLTPYVHPRVALAIISPDRGEGDRTSEFRFDTDLGADLDLTPTLILRLGGTFGDQPGWGVGLAVRPVRH
jgi:hypothetical protein